MIVYASPDCELMRRLRLAVAIGYRPKGQG